jgi:hypothetical protein
MTWNLSKHLLKNNRTVPKIVVVTTNNEDPGGLPEVVLVERQLV